jgi:hypothetical protein
VTVFLGALLVERPKDKGSEAKGYCLIAGKQAGGSLLFTGDFDKVIKYKRRIHSPMRERMRDQ